MANRSGTSSFFISTVVVAALVLFAGFVFAIVPLGAVAEIDVVLNVGVRLSEVTLPFDRKTLLRDVAQPEDVFVPDYGDVINSSSGNSIGDLNRCLITGASADCGIRANRFGTDSLWVLRERLFQLLIGELAKDFRCRFAGRCNSAISPLWQDTPNEVLSILVGHWNNFGFIPGNVGTELPLGGYSSVFQSFVENPIPNSSGDNGADKKGDSKPLASLALSVCGVLFLLISGKLIWNAVKRADNLHVVLVLLAVPFYAAGVLSLLYVSGLAPLLFEWP